MSFLVIAATHYSLAPIDSANAPTGWARVSKSIVTLQSYSFPLLVAVVSKSFGMYKCFKTAGLTASFWAIILGMFFRASGLKLASEVKSGEYFIKIGVTLLAVDYSAIVAYGGPGIVVAWVDTIIIMTVGFFLCMKVFGLSDKESIVLSGATSICGSSAATAIATVLYPGESPAESKARSQVVDPIVALMGLLNTPLMTLLPMAYTHGGLNEATTGAWIGGCIDSTGQVVASGSLATSTVLKIATIVKITQNLLIGPICLLVSIYFNSTAANPQIQLASPLLEDNQYESNAEKEKSKLTYAQAIKLIANQFPVFVIGFFVTSAVATSIIHHVFTDKSDDNINDLVIGNSWTMAEWINLIGFACIGLKIDIFAIAVGDKQQSSILKAYLMVQALDILSTLGFAYLMFHNVSSSGDDDANDDNNL